MPISTVPQNQSTPADLLNELTELVSAYQDAQ